jgi:lipoprotein NlpD
MIRLITSLALPLFLAACMTQPPAPAVERSPAVQTKSAVAVAPQASGPGFYTVKRGDTLYRIALEHGQDYREIAGWNNIPLPAAAIKEGQVLRVLPPGNETTGGAVVSKPVGNGAVVESRPLDGAPAVAAAPLTAGDAVKREPKVGKEAYSDEAYARYNRTSEAPKVEAKPEVASAAAAGAAGTAAASAGPDDLAWAWPSAGKLLAPFSESANKGLDIGGRAGDAVTASADGKVVYAGNGLRGYGELVIIKHNATFLSAYAHNRKILVKEGQQVSRGQKIAEMGNSDADAVKLHFEIRRQGKPVDPMQYLPKK